MRCSEELSLEEDKDYIMSLLAILGSKDASAGYVVQELDGIFCKMAIRSRKCRSGGGEEAVNFDFVTNATTKELEQFKSVCNQLLSRTYIVRTIYQPGKGRVDNPDYLFLSRHYEAVQEYLSLLDWDLRRDELNGYFYVLNTERRLTVATSIKKKRRFCWHCG